MTPTLCPVKFAIPTTQTLWQPQMDVFAQLQMHFGQSTIIVRTTQQPTNVSLALQPKYN